MTFPEPEYAQNLVVGVIIHGTFAWYITDRDYWFLDLPKYESAFLANGYELPTLGDYSERFDIPILNENTADLFLSHIANYRVPSHVLSQMMLTKIDETDGENDLLDFIPCFLVNFDQRQFFSMYPEMIRFELYVPDGWTGKRGDYLSEISEEDKYWIVNGQNLFIKKQSQ